MKRLTCIIVLIIAVHSSHPLLEMLDFADNMPKAMQKAFEALTKISKKKGKNDVAEKLKTFRTKFLKEERFGFTKQSVAGLIKDQIKNNGEMFEGLLRKNPKIAGLMDDHEELLEDMLEKFIVEMMKVWDLEMIAEGPLMKGIEALRDVLNSKAAAEKIPETIRAKLPELRQTIEHITHLMKQAYAGDPEMQNVVDVILSLTDDDDVVVEFISYMFENLSDTMHWILNSQKSQMDFAQLTAKLKSEL